MSPRLTIGRVSITARVPRDQPALPGLAGDLRELAQRLLAPALGQRIAAMLPAGGGVVVVRRLRVDLAVMARWDARRIAARLADAILAALGAALRGEGEAVLQHGSRAAHRAQVLADVAAGRGGLWQHGTCKAMAARPMPQALAAVLEEAGEDGPRALSLLPTETAARVVRHLPQPEVLRLAGSWRVMPGARRGPVAPMPSLIARLAALARAVPPDLWREPPRAALFLLSRDVAERVGEPAALAPAIAFLLAAPVPAGPPRAPSPRPGVDDFSRDAAPRPGEAPSSAPPPRPGPEWLGLTPHAWLYLLWRDALDLGALDLAAVMAGDAAKGAAALARALAGTGRADPAGDAALAPLGLSSGLVPPSCCPAAEVLSRLSAQAWPPARTEATLLLPLGQGWLLANAATGAWLHCGDGSAPDPESFGFPVLAGGLWHPAPPDSPPPLARQPDRPARDAVALTPPGAPDAGSGLAWAALAQAVLRRFARRLPGFGHAGPDWLRANLLGPGALRRGHPPGEPPWLEVVLDPPPLALLLRMGGLLPASYRLPDGTRVDLLLAAG
ncbi:hypothetical protein [Roseomonas marmotae]|uniref:Helicase XPB/Ssl2 N-terminal domain-containing protein n=1 Tax=Roseomonas marmotae TaxID=2768161 RepID=A0ABS3KFB8_9PROT|nr:hypothetical protein [Roseomonas marmotae]MBO1076169.1 hypothetical protein [Roseomonas marmotae]QTI81794.1 hypothetical protein IAI58_20780 [Roseomonas marmotae]